MKCFAEGTIECRVLDVPMEKCQGERCSFYKTSQQLEIEQQKAIARINNLDISERAYIKGEYGTKGVNVRAEKI
ncbi:MAG: hypothetical protein WC454_10645 [Phycisphaerae bacterium]|jgi:hypothetical protein